MSRTLTLIHAGWASVKALARDGRRRDALTQVERLLACPDLPVPVAADAHRVTAARRVLAKARFLCPGNRELAGLWQRVRFEAARVGQNKQNAQDAPLAREGDTVLLPFIRVVGSGAGKAVGGVIRRDVVSKS